MIVGGFSDPFCGVLSAVHCAGEHAAVQLPDKQVPPEPHMPLRGVFWQMLLMHVAAMHSLDEVQSAF